MNLTKGTTVCLIGIAGSGMRGLARLLHARGVTIIGADRTLVSAQNNPAFVDFTIVSEQTLPSYLPEASLLVYSDALPPTHTVREQARAAGIAEAPYHEVLATLTRDYTTLGVAGTHGKSSTTALLAHILDSAHKEPTAIVGAQIVNWKYHSVLIGTGTYFVVEADEYRDHFLAPAFKHAIITSIDHDHPDYFPDLAATLKSFQKFIDALPADGYLVIPERVYKQYQDTLRWPRELITVPLGEKLELTLPGQHMQQNAWLAITLAEKLGVPRHKAVAAVTSFPGLQRRFEKLGTYNTLVLYTDYGHHPTEIVATLQAATEKFPDQKIAVLFEPHTEERLTTFYTDFLHALKPAHSVVLCPVFHARGEVPDPAVVTRLANDLKKEQVAVTVLSNFQDLPSTLAELSQTCTVAIAFTAGDLDGYLRHSVQEKA